MRTICDVCESAAAVVFCAADEAALCPACDQKVHMVNKLASRHVRVGLAEPSEIQRCDICENAPAFFYCEVDGSSLCLQCDMLVHVGGKRTHGRYLLLRQRIEFPGDKSNRTDEHGVPTPMLVEPKRGPNQPSNVLGTQNVLHHAMFSVPENGHDGSGKMENNFDLNARPQRTHGQESNNQEQGSLVPVASLKQETNK